MAGAAVDGDDVALLQRSLADDGAARRVVDDDLLATRDAGLAHAARHHGGVGRHAAARGENAFGGVHAVNVFGAGLDAHQDDAVVQRLQPFGLIGIEHDFTRGSTRRGRKAGGDHVALGSWIERRVQQLVERGGVDAQDCLLLADQAFGSHVDRDLERRLGGALAGAGLQHPQLAGLDGELHVLHVAVVAFEQVEVGLQLAEGFRHQGFE